MHTFCGTRLVQASLLYEVDSLAVWYKIILENGQCTKGAVLYNTNTILHRVRRVKMRVCSIPEVFEKIVCQREKFFEAN